MYIHVYVYTYMYIDIHMYLHIGAMSAAVIYQQQYWGDNIVEGDVLVSNHPQLAGGSHLPDITVITPIFVKGKIVFYVASRGHHADVGGIGGYLCM
jgi:5-oxoprolinase (ATP-hydrolysing)